ncbi:hypothetical protein OG792_12095 [Micromonospora sp. NBC_01699]|uniref:TSCPD domain-containing protein n=1 Tax=Micromonospora sp. NBC_01699 TaxID=2975984 RepID=UPI002E345D1B|nr:hypothetical protein [Micromonospora sp. NBC_01699]
MADVQVGARASVPRRRQGVTVGFVVDGTEGHLVTAALPDGRLSDVLLSVDKQGSTLAGMTEALSLALTTGLRAGAPLSAYVEELRVTRYPPAGPTDDPDIPRTTSLGDYLVRRLDVDYPAGVRRSEHR